MRQGRYSFYGTSKLYQLRPESGLLILCNVFALVFECLIRLTHFLFDFR